MKQWFRDILIAIYVHVLLVEMITAWACADDVVRVGVGCVVIAAFIGGVQHTMSVAEGVGFTAGHAPELDLEDGGLVAMATTTAEENSLYSLDLPQL